MLSLAFEAEWDQVLLQKQTQINKYNYEENKSHLDCNHSVGNRALTTDPTSKKLKLERTTDGPFIVTRARDNGTIRIQKEAVDETLNIIRVLPFLE